MKNTFKSIAIAIENNYLPLPKVETTNEKSLAQAATITSNLNYFGYMPTVEMFEFFTQVDQAQLSEWWSMVKPVFETISGDNKNINEHIVYKNFPQEVMSMSDAEYFFKQILIYFGVPYEHLQDEKQPRPELTEKVTYKVLQEAPENLLSVVFNSLVTKASKWTPREVEVATFIFEEEKVLNIQDFAFKMNAIALSRIAYENDKPIIAKNAMDVLRVALQWSEMAESIPAKKVKFKTFSRKERRFILSALESTHTLINDLGMKKALWKKLFQRLNPSDYKFDKVNQAYDLIYNKKVVSFESSFKKALSENNPNALLLAKEKSAGFYLRNLHVLYKAFGKKAFVEMSKQLQSLTINQLLKLETYVLTENNKNNRIIAPKGNWQKSVIIPNNKVRFMTEDIDFLTKAISEELNTRLSVFFPNGILLSKETKDVKIPTNDMKLDFYGRGTSFPIPENIESIRLFSYWETGHNSNVWFDNGVTVLDENKKKPQFCDWTTSMNRKVVQFSGDPLPSSDRLGRGAQGINLKIKEMVEAGHRYVLWSILSYNAIPFNEANEVYGNLQFCESEEDGQVFEPSRSQLSFSIKDNNLTKYVAYIDLVERKVVFLDANFKMHTSTIRATKPFVEERFSALLEYVASQPSVYDLFKHMKDKVEYSDSTLEDVLSIHPEKVVIGYSDEKLNFIDSIEESDEDSLEPEVKKVNAYLFKHTKETNSFDRVNILDILSK